MSTATLSLPAAPRNSLLRTLRIFVMETRFEFVRALRTRTYSLSVIGFPVMFYILFGLMMNRGAEIHGINASKLMLGGYAVFGVVGAALFGIGVGVSGDLGAGWLELKRASPMPPLAYLMAKCCTAMAFGVLIVSILSVLGMTIGQVHLTLIEFGKIVLLTMVGAIPFASMGLLLALLVPFNSAPGIANLLYLPMSFLGGLWVPLSLLPKIIQKIAPIMPTYHLAQLMLSVFGAQDKTTPAIHHWVNLIVFTFAMLGIAGGAFHRREQNA